jgi:hypothetical protein
MPLSTRSSASSPESRERMARDGGEDLPVRRLADGDGGAQGHEVEPLLRRELLQEHLGHRVRLGTPSVCTYAASVSKKKSRWNDACAAACTYPDTSPFRCEVPGLLVQHVAVAFQRPAGDGGSRRGQDHALHRAGFHT